MKVDTDKAKDIDEEVEFEAIFQPKKLWVFRWSTIDIHSLPETPKKVDGANASHGGWLIRAPYQHYLSRMASHRLSPMCT